MGIGEMGPGELEDHIEGSQIKAPRNRVVFRASSKPERPR
jgi:hypothetical protein